MASVGPVNDHSLMRLGESPTVVVVSPPSRGPGFFELAGFGVVVFSTSFGIAWALFKREQHAHPAQHR